METTKLINEIEIKEYLKDFNLSYTNCILFQNAFVFVYKDKLHKHYFKDNQLLIFNDKLLEQIEIESIKMQLKNDLNFINKII